MSTNVIFDVMSGDLGPEPAIEAACQISLEKPIHLCLVGKRDMIESILKKHKHNPENIEIIDAPDVLTMDHSPKDILTTLQNSSLAVALQKLSQEPNSAFVTAGNTGALILGSKHYLHKIRGIHKAAFCTIYPTQLEGEKPHYALILDVGATTRCTPDELVQFAKMGSCYAKLLFNIEKPVVALLNIGTEPHKGSEELKITHQLLSNSPEINFSGNIEANQLPNGTVDVVVCEGMIGNAVVKTAEGLSSKFAELGKHAFKSHLLWKLGIILLASGLRTLKKITDYKEYGGAPLLGFESLCIKAHGRSDTKALKNAVIVAARAAEQKLGKSIQATLQL